MFLLHVGIISAFLILGTNSQFAPNFELRQAEFAAKVKRNFANNYASYLRQFVSEEVDAFKIARENAEVDYQDNLEKLRSCRHAKRVKNLDNFFAEAKQCFVKYNFDLDNYNRTQENRIVQALGGYWNELASLTGRCQSELTTGCYNHMENRAIAIVTHLIPHFVNGRRQDYGEIVMARYNINWCLTESLVRAWIGVSKYHGIDIFDCWYD